MTFSEKLKQAMQELHLNQRQVCGMTGKSKGSVSQYLSGKQIPSEDVQSAIAVALGLESDYFSKSDEPPNPAKLSDSRCGKYIDEYGDESWELDALEPSVITNLITNEVTAFRDDEIYQAVCDLEKRGKEELKMIERNYDRAVAFLESEV